MHPNSSQNAPFDASQQLMPNGGVPPGYPPPQQTPYYQGHGAPQFPHQEMQPHYPNPHPHYPTPPPATQMTQAPGMPPMQALPGMQTQWPHPPPHPAQQQNVSAPMLQGNQPPPLPYGSQPGYLPAPPCQPYGWLQAQMPGYYYPAPAMPNPQYQHLHYGHSPYGHSHMGTAPERGYAQPPTVSSLGTTSTLPRDSAEQDLILQSENSLPQQMQNMSLNLQTTQPPDPRQYQQPYPRPDPSFNQQLPLSPGMTLNQPPAQTPNMTLNQPPAQTPNMTLNQPPAQTLDMALNQQQFQTLDMALNQQQFQTPDPRLSQQTIPTPDPIQSEQMTQVSDPRSRPLLTNSRTEEGSSVQVTEGPVGGAGLAPEAPQGTSFASYPVDPSMTQETERSNSPPTDSQDDPMLKDFVTQLQARLEELSKEKQTEMVRKALQKLGLEQCIDALEEEFGMDTLFNTASGRTI